MAERNHLEWIADTTLRAAGYADPAVDAIDVAECCGLLIRWRNGAAQMMGRVIYLNRHASRLRRQAGAAHELAHALLQAHGLRDTETRARYLAGCILVPRVSLLGDIAAHTAAEVVRARHPHATRAMVARRFAQASAWLASAVPMV